MSDPGRAKLSVPEAAEYLGVSVRTFYEHVRPGLPAIRIGARVVFDSDDLDKWAELQKVAPRSDGSLVGPGTKRLPTVQPARMSAASKAEPLVIVDPVSKRLVFSKERR